MVRSNEFISNFSSKNGSNFSSTHTGSANLTLTVSFDIDWLTMVGFNGDSTTNESTEVSDSKSDS